MHADGRVMRQEQGRNRKAAREEGRGLYIEHVFRGDGRGTPLHRGDGGNVHHVHQLGAGEAPRGARHPVEVCVGGHPLVARVHLQDLHPPLHNKARHSAPRACNGVLIEAGPDALEACTFRNMGSLQDSVQMLHQLHSNRVQGMWLGQG